MSNTEKLKTAGLNADGTSRLSVTKKKKSKSRWIVPAIIGGAALFAGIGGMGASSGQGFLSSLLGTGKKAAGTIGSSISSFFSGGSSSEALTAINPSISKGALGTATNALKTTQESGIFGTLFDKLGSLSGSQLIGLGQIAGVAGSTLGALLEEDNSIDPERLFEEEKRQFDLMLAAEYDIAGAKIDLANREGALAGTFMGFTNPIFGDTDSVKGSVTPGYTPSKPASIAGIHPVSGGLISQAENTA
tara:strand:- start:33414 stop:34154 length:741 start_codon:yes stop_codon:yes gene_type:complete